jgi:hypothetical protein
MRTSELELSLENSSGDSRHGDAHSKFRLLRDLDAFHTNCCYMLKVPALKCDHLARHTGYFGLDR